MDNNWLIISKMILKTFINSFFSRVRKDPVFALLPVIILVIIFAGSWYLYRQTYLNLVGFESTQTLNAFIWKASGNIFLAFFTAFFILSVIFFQAGSVDKKTVDLIKTTPTTKGSITLGLFLPNLIIPFVIIIFSAIPVMLAICNLLSMDLLSKVFVCLIFLIYLTAPVLLATAFSLFSRRLSRYIFSSEAENKSSLLNLLFVVFIIFSTIRLIIFTTYNKTSFITYLLPPAWMHRFLIFSYQGMKTGILFSSVVICLYFFVALFLCLLSFSAVSNNETSGRQFKALNKLPFSANQILSLMALELKLFVRDMTYPLYVLLVVLLFAGGAVLLKTNDDLVAIVPMYIQAISYGLILTLSVIVLTARGSFKKYDEILFTTPLKIFNFIFAKELFYAFFLSFSGVSITYIILKCLNVYVEGSIFTQVFLYFLASALAYFTGSVFIVDKNNMASQITGSFIYISCLAALISSYMKVEKLIQSSFSVYAEKIITYSAYFAGVAVLVIAAFAVEKVRRRYVSN